MPAWASVDLFREVDSMPVIVVERRTDDIMAYLKGNKGIWGCGRTQAQAIGHAIISNPEAFGLVVETDEQSFERFKHIPLDPP